MTVEWLLGRNADLFRDKIAFVDEHRKISHMDFFDEVKNISHILQKSNIGAQSIVLTMPEKSIDSVIIFFALLNSKISFLHGMKSFSSEVDFPYSHTLTTIDDGYSDVSFQIEKNVYYLSKKNEVYLPYINEGSYIISTSGTTGAKKHIISSFYQIAENAKHVCAFYNLDESIVSMTLYPPFRVFFDSFMRAVYLGGKSVLVDSFYPEIAAQLIREEKVTFIQGTPSQHLSLAQRITAHDASSVKIIEVAGGHFSKKAEELVEKSFANSHIVRAWGSTETAGVCIAKKEQNNNPNNIGKVLPGYEMKILTNGGVNNAVEGEMLIKGESVTKKIFYQGEFINISNFYSTGDMVEIDKHGDVIFLGRKSGMIKSAGDNIYPSEIETLIAKHPHVNSAIIVGINDDFKGEIPVAYVQIDQEDSVTREDLRKYCIAHLDFGKVPKYWLLSVENAPIMPSGKVDKGKIRELILNKIILGE